jgi:hypothetical protein
MEAIRSFTANNRGMIMNGVYIAAVLLVVYYLYKFLLEGNDVEFICQSGPTDANRPAAAALTKKNVKAETGGEYTLSFWMYISNWDYRSGQAKSVIQLVDRNTPAYSLLTTILYPNEAKMMVRVHTEGTSQGGTDYTMTNNAAQLLSGAGGASMFTPSSTMPMCDIQDIDLQRWINVTISVNGRIVDVYYDGKLNRSCVLKDIPSVPENSVQAVVWGNNGGFGGQISAVVFYAYALTPDKIYSIYQAGPGSAGGLIGYVGDMLGIKLNYSGSGGVQKSI